MPAFTRGGITEPVVTTPLEWPEFWDFPDDVIGPWPPGWPKKAVLAQSPALVLASSKTGVVFVDVFGGDEAPATAAAAIPYTVDITQVGGAAFTNANLANHLVQVSVLDSNGATIAVANAQPIVVGGAGVTQITGTVTPTLDKPGAGYSVTLKAAIISLNPDRAVTVAIPVTLVTLSLSASSACTGATLTTTVGVNDNGDGLFSAPTVTSATATEV